MHTVKAAMDRKVKTVAMAGGVASNSSLRDMMEKECEKHGINVIYPPPVLCTDNAAMIAAAGYFGYLDGDIASSDLNAVANLSL